MLCSRHILFACMEKFQLPCLHGPKASAAVWIWDVRVAQYGLCHMAGSFAGHSLQGHLQRAGQGPASTLWTKAPACPLLSSSFLWFAVLDSTSTNLNGLARETGCSKARVKFQGYCTVSSLKEGTRKRNQVLWTENLQKWPRVGLGTSHRINSALSMAEFYTLYLTHHNWAKLSGLSFIIVKNYQTSTVTGRGLLE